jgi:hypothetical protein
MRKVIYIFFTAILTMALWSCSEDILDDINKDINNPGDVESRLIITDAMTSSAFNLYGGDFALFTSIYIEHNTGTFNQFYYADIRSSQPTASATYDNAWVGVYANLYYLKIIREKCSEGGSEVGNYHTLGIAQILTALNLAALTDLMGDVPWIESCQPGVIFTPELDSQESIYTDVFKLLDDGIENLDKETIYPSLGTQDVLYGGDTDSWKKFAYGLKARYTMRLSFKSPKYADVITYANQSFTSADEQAQFLYNGNTSQSPFFCIFRDRDYYGASQSLHEKLVARNDPRDAVFWRLYPNTTGDLIFAPNGMANQVSGYYSVSALSTITAPTYLMSYHELEFLKAEAYVRLNSLTNAADALKKGITAAFQKVNVGLSAAAAATYFDNVVNARFNANPLSEVMNQKYIAFYEEESIEAYNDFRRLKAMGNNVIILNNPKNTNQFPLRLTYGNSDVTTNTNVRQAYGDGTYVYTENVWWAGGTR